MENYKAGSFLTLKKELLVEDIDAESYNQMTQTLVKSQGLAAFFGVFWARLLESSNWFPNYKSRNQKIGYYTAAAFIPSLINLFFSTKKYTSDLKLLDTKYTKLFLERSALRNAKNNK